MQSESTPLLPKTTTRHPEERASCISKLTFTWLGQVVREGYRKAYEMADLLPLRSIDSSDYVYNKLNTAWHHELTTSSPSLARAIRKAFGFNMYIAGICKLFGDLFGFIGPICLNYIIKYLEDPSTAWFAPTYYGYSLCFALFLSSIFSSVLLHQHHHLVIREGIHVRTALIAMVFRKSLKLPPHVQQNLGTGRIINHQSTDAARIMDLFYFIHYIWAAPLQLVISIVLLLQYLGFPALAGLAVMIVVFPIGAFLAKLMGTVSKQMLVYTDQRVGLLNEIFQGIRVVKFYAWEYMFKEAVEEIRALELGKLKRFMIFYSLNSILMQAGPILVALSSFAVYAWTQDEPLSPDKAFTSITLFGILRLPLMMLPRILTLMVQARVSWQRLEEFFLSDDLEDRPVSSTTSNVVVEVSNVNFYLNKDTAIRNVDLTVSKGELVMIHGHVGSGKTSLIHGLLGELNHDGGSVSLHGSVAYVAQHAWILNSTIRENILFGKEYQAEKFNRVLKSCVLDVDLQTLPAGVETEIGERGVTLSGGQKQRISIARAVYSDKDIYIFDDCLSALDGLVGKQIFEQCICNALAHKTRILVTHAVQFADRADQVVVMNQLKIESIGSLSEIKKTSPIFRSVSLESEDEQQNPEEVAITKGGKLMKVEERLVGSVSLRVYFSYLVSCGMSFVVFVGILIFMSNTLKILSDLWLTHWTQAHAAQENTAFYLKMYAYLSFGTIGILFFSDISGRFAAVRASKRIHDALFASVLHAPTEFYDTTPLGRVMNRFSNDINTIDQKLGASVLSLIGLWMSLFGMLIVQCAVAHILIVIIIPVGLMYIFIQQYYRRTTRELQRLDNISKSPIYAHFTQTLDGLSTLRAYRVEQRFILENQNHVDQNTRAFWLLNLVNRWLGVRLEALGAIITLSIALLVNTTSGTAAAALGGLILSYAQTITGTLNWAVRANIDTENMMNSIERTDEYSDIPPESNNTILSRPPDHWPDNGVIEFQNVSARYRSNLDLVLKNVSFTIRGGEKIGLCGRTGSGKSSLVLLLYRMIQPCDGSVIRIDTIDTSRVSLYDLRSKIAIIPQDPVLFAHTVRFNLDPDRQHSTEELWNALEKAQLKSLVLNLKDQLETRVNQSGENFSVGERQLFCLARALLRRSKILILDEATASVDQKTDQLIQKRLRNDFIHCTILTIAHRLETIMDYDKILVLENGHLVEFDSPLTLLSNPQGHLFRLAGPNLPALKKLTSSSFYT